MKAPSSLPLLALLLAGCPASPAATQPAPKTETHAAPQNEDRQAVTFGWVTADDGVRIRYLVAGTGTPVVLIHGYYADAESNWVKNGLVAALAETNRVIAIDNRGHGASDKPHDAAAYGDRMWRDTLKVMDALSITKAHVHGYSMGGSILTQLLFHHPERVLTAIYGGSGIEEVDPAERGRVPADAAGPDPEEAGVKKWLLGSMTHDLEAMKAVKENAPWSGPEEKTLDLSKIKIPVLALNGEFDEPNAKTHRMKRELPSFESVVFKGKSHLTTIAAGYMPDEYKRTLVAFIRRHNP